MPDALLGEARVNLSEQSLGDSSVAGSGGGANVQVWLCDGSFQAIIPSGLRWEVSVML